MDGTRVNLILAALQTPFVAGDAVLVGVDGIASIQVLVASGNNLDKVHVVVVPVVGDLASMVQWVLDVMSLV